MQSRALHDQAYAANLPLVGPALQSTAAFQFAQQFSAAVAADLAQVDTSDPANNPVLPQIVSEIAKAFQITPDQISVKDQAGGAVTTDAQVAAASKVEFSFVKTSALISGGSIPFALGSSLGGLPLAAKGATVDLGLSYTLPVRFGVDGGTSGTDFYVDVSATNDLQVNVFATPTNLTGGSLGFLQVNLTPAGVNGLNVSLKVDVAGGIVRSDFSSLTATAALSGAFDIHLRVDANVSGATINPKIGTTLNVHWDLADSNATAGLLGDNAPVVSFGAITVDGGSIIQGLLAPYLNEVEKVVRPVQQLADLLLARPIAQLPITYLDLIEFATRAGGNGNTLQGLIQAFNAAPSDLKQFLNKVKAIGNLLEQARSATGNTFTIADFNPTTDVRTAGAISVPAGAGSNMADALNFNSAIKKFDTSSGTFKTALNLDLLDDTTNIYKLLVGDPTASLVSFDLTASNTLSSSYSFTTLVSIIPVQFTLGGSLTSTANLDIGYDASGFARFKGTGKAADLLDGLYIGTDTNLSFMPAVDFAVKGGFDDSTILGLIQSYTGVDVPPWVADLAGIHPQLTVVGDVNLNATVQFSVADKAGSNDNRLHYDELPSGSDIGSAIKTTGSISLDASATLNYGIHAELPGKKIFDRLGLGKVVGGAKFDVGGQLALLPKIHVPLYTFGNSAATGDIKPDAPTPPVVSITVTGPSTMPTADPTEFIANEGVAANLMGTATTANRPDDHYSYTWQQLTAKDLPQGILYYTPPVTLSSPNAQATTFIARAFSVTDNPRSPGGFTLVGFEDRYQFRLTVTDLDTGLSSNAVVSVVAQDVNPTVAAPTSSINNVDTSLVGVRGFDLDLKSSFDDPGNQETFNATWNFGDPTGAGNIVSLPIQPANYNPQNPPEKLLPGPVAASHTFHAAGTYTVGLHVTDGFADTPPRTLGFGDASASVSIAQAAVLPDKADATKLALYVGGTDQSETITLGRDPANGMITVSMPDFSGEFNPNVAHIYINSLGGDDTILFDFSHGNFVPGPYVRTGQSLSADGTTLNSFQYTDSGGAIIDGGTGVNRYQAVGGSFDSVSAALLPDTNGVYQNGYVEYVPAPGAAGILVNFLHIQSVYELSGANEFLVSGNPDADLFTVQDGPTVGTTTTTQVLNGPTGERGILTFANKPLLYISGGNGADTFVVNNPHPATGLTNITLDGDHAPVPAGQVDDQPDDNASDNFYIRATGADVTAYGRGGNDVFVISSTAGIDNQGNLDGIIGNVTIDAGSGAANSLTVIDYSAATGNPDVVLTGSSITGFAPGIINYSATGGSFGAAPYGIVLVGSSTQADRFNIRGTFPDSQTLIEGLGGNDVFDISSNAPGMVGTLDGIKGPLTLDGGVGHYLDGRPASNLRGQISLDRVRIEADADYTLADTLTNPADDTAYEARLSANPAGSRVGIPDIRLISIESAVLIGGPSANRIDASAFRGAVVEQGMGGDDMLIGGSGNNTLISGAGNSTLIGGNQRSDGATNNILGGGGVNLLIAGPGTNTLIANSGTTTMIGGVGQNTFVINNPPGTVLAPIGGYEVIGANNPGDRLVLNGGGGPDFKETWVVGPLPDPSAPANITTPDNLGLDIPTIVQPAHFDGEITIANGFGGLTQPVTQQIRYVGIATVSDKVVAASLTVTADAKTGTIAPASTNNLATFEINLTRNGAPISPTSYQFSNKSTVGIYGTNGLPLATASFLPPPLLASTPSPVAVLDSRAPAPAPVVPTETTGTAPVVAAPPAVDPTPSVAPVAPIPAFGPVALVATTIPAVGPVALVATSRPVSGTAIVSATPHPVGPAPLLSNAKSHHPATSKAAPRPKIKVVTGHKAAAAHPARPVPAARTRHASAKAKHAR